MSCYLWRIDLVDRVWYHTDQVNGISETDTNSAHIFCSRFEFQMQYGSIGWSVGATLGYAQAARNKRVISCIGDGSFQVSDVRLLVAWWYNSHSKSSTPNELNRIVWGGIFHLHCQCYVAIASHGLVIEPVWYFLCVQVTAQDISTMIRCGQKSIIFLINNGGYTIEVEIHDGPYNVIKNWNYTAFVDAIHNGEGKCWTAKVI